MNRSECVSYRDSKKTYNRMECMLFGGFFSCMGHIDDKQKQLKDSARRALEERWMKRVL